MKAQTGLENPLNLRSNAADADGTCCFVRLHDCLEVELANRDRWREHRPGGLPSELLDPGTEATFLRRYAEASGVWLRCRTATSCVASHFDSLPTIRENQNYPSVNVK